MARSGRREDDLEGRRAASQESFDRTIIRQIVKKAPIAKILDYPH
jgi:hypothetical protein